MGNREELVVNKILGQDGTELQFPVGSNDAFIRTSTGTTTLMAASSIERVVIMDVVIVTSFAAGDGAAPDFLIGETGSTSKFAATGVVTGTAGAHLQFSGVLSANKALLCTATAATGTTSTGAATITAIAVKNV